MPTLTIQVGQCGNQLGSAIFSSLSSPSIPSPSSLTPSTLPPPFPPPPPSQFFRTTQNCASCSTPIARAILIDTEPKVVERCLTSSTNRDCNFRYSKSNSCVIGAGGAANNWARGYASSSEVLEKCMDKVTGELEKSPYTPSVHLLHSCAGGTGSGLGCSLTRSYSDYHGGKTLLFNTIITPFESGEVIVQDYNSALTLSSLIEYSDAILCIENEVASRACSKMLKIAHPGVKELNGVIGDSVSSLISDSYPSLTEYTNSSNSLQLDDIIRHMVPHSSYKMLSHRMVPMMPEGSIEFSRDTWESGVVKRLRQMHRCGETLECDVNWRKDVDTSVSIANLLVLRGDGGLPRMDTPKRNGILDLESPNQPPLNPNSNNPNSNPLLPTPPQPNQPHPNPTNQKAKPPQHPTSGALTAPPSPPPTPPTSPGTPPPSR